MTPELMITEMVGRFREGLGAKLTKQYSVRGTAGQKTKALDVYFFPRALVLDGTPGLLIFANKGTYEVIGDEQVNPYKLIASGIQPIELAQDIAAIANAFLGYMQQLEQSKPKALTGPQE